MGDPMNIIISNTGGKPIYDQIKEQIKNAVLAGELRSGDALPSIRMLAKELRISVITTKRAYEELEREGYIYSVPGKGSFVADISQLKDVRREEIRRALEQTARRAFVSGISKDEFLEDAGKAYEKRREQE